MSSALLVFTFRLPRHKSFDYAPRHYDPIKEEIEERTDRIRKELQAEGVIDSPEGENEERRRHAANISFRRTTSSDNNASLIRLLIAVVLGSLAVGWLYYGDKVLYALVLVLPAYVYFRFKNIRGKGN
ncbi:MAG: hypothetical protein AAFO69_11780, partial [Bacteroidota bacterium]